jgi:antirestriction protein
MPVTIAANYREVFTPETVEKIDELLEENYALDDMIQFIDENSESDFVRYYEEYVNQGENLGYDVVDAFVEHHGISCVEYAQDAYRGLYDSEASFAEEFTTDVYGEVPSYVVVDWKATWECNLRHDYIFVKGFVFDRNF